MTSTCLCSLTQKWAGWKCPVKRIDKITPEVNYKCTCIHSHNLANNNGVVGGGAVSTMGVRIFNVWSSQVRKRGNKQETNHLAHCSFRTATSSFRTTNECCRFTRRIVFRNTQFSIIKACSSHSLWKYFYFWSYIMYYQSFCYNLCLWATEVQTFLNTSTT